VSCELFDLRAEPRAVTFVLMKIERGSSQAVVFHAEQAHLFVESLVLILD
jgi:hypothetical protein